MAKSRQSRKSAGARRKSTTPRPVSSVVTQSAPSQVSAPPLSKKVDLVSEYHYVISDLKRLGVLAASMFVLLVVLALVIR